MRAEADGQLVVADFHVRVTFEPVITSHSWQQSPKFAAPVPALLTFLQPGLEIQVHSDGIEVAQDLDLAHQPTTGALEKLHKPIPDEQRSFYRALPATIKEAD